jgi:hypothetical protein
VTKSRFATRLIAGLALLVTLVLAGCSPVATPSPATPLVTVESRGGLCAGGPCGTTIMLDRDGRVRLAAKPPNELGRVPVAQVAAIEALIRTTDFAALRSHPFSGLCPTAADGQELVFEFSAPSGTERIATCEVQVDFSLPLFAAVSAALGSYIALPGR